MKSIIRLMFTVARYISLNIVIETVRAFVDIRGMYIIRQSLDSLR